MYEKTEGKSEKKRWREWEIRKKWSEEEKKRECERENKKRQNEYEDNKREEKWKRNHRYMAIEGDEEEDRQKEQPLRKRRNLK